jgi:hypothetical protein
MLFEVFALLVVEDIVEHDMDVFPAQHRDFDPAHLAVDAGHGLLAGADMQVGGAIFLNKHQELGDIHSSTPYRQEGQNYLINLNNA